MAKTVKAANLSDIRKAPAKTPVIGVFATSDPRIDDASRKRCQNIARMAADTTGGQVVMPAGSDGMDNHSQTKRQLKVLYKKIDALLQQISGCRFSGKANIALRKVISRYARELLAESVAISYYRQEDGVSARDVMEASARLEKGPTRGIIKHLGMIGGILCGASIPTFLPLVSGEQYPAATIFLGFMGTFLVALHITRAS